MRAGRIVFDGAAHELTAQAARDIYGAEGAFNEAATSTSLGSLTDQPVAARA